MSTLIFLILSICFIAPFYLIFISMKKKRRDIEASKLPPGPKKLPIIGNLHQIGKLPHRSLLNLSKKYGDLMFLQLGSIPTLVVSSPDMAREIIKSHDLVFSGRPSLYAARKITYNYVDITFAPYGEYWREIRRIVVLELMTVKRVKSFGNVRIQEVALMVENIARATNVPINLSEVAFSLANKVVCCVAFGTSHVDGTKSDIGHGFRIQQLNNEAQRLLAEFNVADYFPRMGWFNMFNGVDKRLDKTFQCLDKYLDQVIEEHLDLNRPKGENEDIIDVLLRIQKDSNLAFTLKNEHLKGVLLDIFVAGTDTSAATIIWTMAELLRNPKVKQKAQQEVRSQVARGNNKTVEESDLPKLKFLKAVIKESWRLHPPAPLLVPRETIENCIIDNKYAIPAKTRVFFNAAAIQTDPKHWENPEKFWPERFLDSEIDFRGQHFEFLPFGAGRRGCPAINFAVPLVELALANLLFSFDWELPNGIYAEDLDMEEEVGIAMDKKIPLLCIASPVLYV
ncbi:hypothetical protein RD792_014891 [Penstemon davidsonii]|uniref:Cytochrome P450 n=1 Tax=Penstemon davidsonii TaxID=160366 RepID=A0ABR0CQN2_9LAMI|nr:hypothetical protein RD792_014891 [Penstemon davidsonii]